MQTTTLPLSPEHKQHLLDAGISLDVINDRGYHSATSRKLLNEHGFSDSQSRCFPALVLPVYDVYGKVAFYQIRPDDPREVDGKAVKYETPLGQRSHIDVPKRSLPHLSNTKVPLWITEGVKKADAAVSQGLCCVSIQGVWNWCSRVEGDKESRPLDDWNKIALKHRRVYICFDSDVMTNSKVAEALRRLTAMLRGCGATVVRIYLPAVNGEKVGLDDYFAAGGTALILGSLTKRARVQTEHSGIRADLRTIETHDRQLAVIVDEALDALVEANEPPTVFVCGGKLTRLRVVEVSGKEVPGLEAFSKDAMLYQLSQAANFESISDQGKRNVNPPDIIARSILSHAEWPKIPALSGVVTSPIFSRDGTLCAEPGYNPSAQVIYHEQIPLNLPSIIPNQRAVDRAVEMLYNLLTDFPFADDASFAHAVAFLLLPFVREMIDGPTPLHLFDAPKAGTGKSLLMSILANVFIPGGIMVQTAPKDEEEWRKRLTTMFRSGSSHLLLDNIRELTSENLQAALTSPACLWQDRLLGQNETLSLPIRCAWAATCNNLQGTIEQLRRCVQIRLDSKMDKPETRSKFRHPDPHLWLSKNRPAVVESVLTLVVAWVAEGRPSYSGKNPPMGSFEGWTRVMGGILESAGIDGFLDNREEFTAQADSESGSINAFIAEWSLLHGTSLKSARELLSLALNFFDSASSCRITAIR